MSRTNFEEKVRKNRLFFIDELIHSGSYSNATILAKITEITPWTILCDTNYLHSFYHIPFAYDAWRRGYYYTKNNFFIKSVLLSEGEPFFLALFNLLLLTNTAFVRTDGDGKSRGREGEGDV
jgi:hypothetical protein